MRTHIHFIQIHCKVRQTTGFEFQQARFIIPLKLILADSVFIVLTAGVAFQLKGKYGDTVQEDNEVYAFAFLVIHLFHNRKGVELIERLRLRIKGVGGFAVHQAERDAGIEFHAVLQHIQQAAVFLVDLIIDVIEDRLPRLISVELVQLFHRLGLRLFKKRKQQFRIHTVAGIISCRGANLITVPIAQHFKDIRLIVGFLSQLSAFDSHLT